MRAKYPNLELIEFKCKEMAIELYPKADWDFYNSYLDVFIQHWSTTARGFDFNGGFSGQAITPEYITVFSVYDKDGNDYYIVCFGNDIAYDVLNPNESFLKDLRDRNMASQKHMRKYIGG